MKTIDKGQGSPALFFVHGFLCASDDWTHQFSHFQQRHRVVAPTFWGHGGTDRCPESLSVSLFARDCIKLLEEKEINDVVLIGHSMGTRVLFAISQEIPEKVRGMVLLDGSRISGSGGRDRCILEFRAEVKNIGYENFITRTFSAMVSNPKFVEFRNRLVRRALDVPEDWAMELRCSTIEFDSDAVETAVQNARMPLLVIQSTDKIDNQIYTPLKPGDSAAYAAFIKANAPHADLSYLSDVGHFAAWEVPELVNSQIEDWMDKKNIRSEFPEIESE
ncbi:MAG: alpha/beta fold hydrolase [Methyloligellaceae bacterium]